MKVIEIKVVKLIYKNKKVTANISSIKLNI